MKFGRQVNSRAAEIFFASFAALLIFLAGARAAEVDPARIPPAATTQIDFAHDIQPILERSCLKCHSGEKPKGKFSLTTRETLLKGGQDQVDILPGHSAKSPLIHFVARLITDSEMPPEGKGDPLSKEQIGLLRAWVDQGAKWPSEIVLQNPEGGNIQHSTSNARHSTKELPPVATKKIDFVKDIQPIFQQSCLGCHGPKKQESELRWDNKEIALKGGDHGAVIIPGKSAESKMIQLVAGFDEEKIMPQKGERLTAEQIGLLRAWIDQGAIWPDSASVKIPNTRDHWAFKAPVRPTLPKVKNQKWIRNSIDNFVLAKLEQEKLSPSREADKITLVRRLSLDLIGLPPTPKEIDDFLADKNSDAYEKLIERLLASPHYGERWGRHWLDAARYADSNGFEKDLPRSIWPYRDWVINAFNRDEPFDQFAVEQLAGDLLPNATTEQKVATGFLRNSMINEEGGVDPEQFRIESIIDRMDTMGKAFLGLTINCCQCHNHKYDPIKQADYYQLFAFLNNDDEPQLEVPNKEQQAGRVAIRKKIYGIENDLLKKFPDIPKKMDAWEKEMQDLVRDWIVMEPRSFYGSVGTKFNRLKDKSLLATASNPPVSDYTISFKTDLKDITGFRLETLTDPNLPLYGPGRSANGNFVLTEFKLDAAPANLSGKTNHVILQNATADFSQKGFPVTAAIDGSLTNKTGWAAEDLPGRRNHDHRAVFETKENVGYDGGTILTFTLSQSQGAEQAIGRLRLSATTGKRLLRADPLTPHAREIISIPKEKRTKKQQRELFSFYRVTDSRFAEANKKIDEEQSKWPGAPTTLVLLARADPRETHIFKRGDWRKPGALVSPGVPSIFHPLPNDAPRNRLTLAKWLVDKKNPTLARVIVNRMWQEYFGRGLVMTAEDFGTQGERPSHPELLDWLATEFMERGWSMKTIHRLIANSATYRQSSVITPQLWERDQYNRLLARGPRVRVEAEIIHDIALRASGLLSEKIGGPSVYPPIPDGVLKLAYGTPMKWETEKNESRYRRGMYTFWKRSLPYPSMSIFDAPNADFACPRRLRSNTPLQALTTLNDPVFFEAAQSLALRIWKEGGKNDRDRAQFAFRLCTGRIPKPKEVETVLSLLNDQENYFEDRTTTAIEVASPDQKNPAKNVNLHKVAAWTMVSRVLLNLDETITKE